MAKVKRTAVPEEFNSAHTKGKELGEKNDCSVKSIAIITGEPYEKCLAALTKVGRPKNTGVSLYRIRLALNELGFETQLLGRSDLYRREGQGLRQEGEMRKLIDSYPSPHHNLKHATTHHPRRFAKQWESFPDCLFGTDGHVLAFKDGEIKDWSINKSLRITEMILVKKKGA